MTDEIQQQIDKFNSSRRKAQENYDDTINKLRLDYQREVSTLEDQLKDKKFELNESYKRHKENIEDIEREEARTREIEKSRLIAEEEQNVARKIQKLEEDYKNRSREMEIDFLAFSEQIDLKKETLSKIISDYEDKQQKIIARFKEDEEVRNQRDYYRIQINDAAAQDVQKLKNLALSFNNSDVIYKLIWEVYYKAHGEALMKKILGANGDKGGIYKITNINNEKVYIGRTAEFKSRWRIHMKRGCGIDRIKGLLYDAMMNEGLENFTFQIVEVCDKDKQVEREKYWIQFYHSDGYGYNQKVG